MLEESEVTCRDLLLCEADFPKNYKNMSHPDDYKERDEPLPVSRFINEKLGHWRLIMRVSFKLANGKYLPMSFVCDSGAPYHFYLSDKAMDMLTSGGRIKPDEVENPYMDDIVGGKAAVKETPYNHKPANIMGLRMMQRLGCKISQDSFDFESEFSHF